jgi:ubiquinone/menaquinone biosynthesis C-methylase UbiE
MENKMQNVTSPQVIKNQYGTDSGLNSRIRIKKLFSTGKQGWGNFLFQNFCLKPNDRILELGCGNAVFWKAIADRVPTGVKLTLSDFSEGMLESAKSNTNKLIFIENYAVIDAQYLPQDDNTFDVVIANYMLYHVPLVEKALSEISRVLKPNGFFFAATFGKDNLKEVTDIFYNYDNIPLTLTNYFPQRAMLTLPKMKDYSFQVFRKNKSNFSHQRLKI